MPPFLPTAKLLGEEPTPLPVRKPWNPTAILWLGVLFTPVWAGIMAALNNRRLGLAHPSWVGPLIGVGCTFVALTLGEVWDIPTWVDVVCYTSRAQ